MFQSIRSFIRRRSAKMKTKSQGNRMSKQDFREFTREGLRNITDNVIPTNWDDIKANPPEHPFKRKRRRR